jgi:subtilase family serine protease
MRRPLFAALSAAAVLITVGLAPSAGAAPSASGLANRNVHVCSAPVAGSAACHAIRHDRVDANGKVTPMVTPSGYGPADIQSAYNLAGITAVAGTTVAIVDAYNDPNAEADLATYRSTYGLPACTTGNGCFKKVNQNGGTSMPRTNGGWAQEISLDLDMVSAACPSCKILLVEASSASFSNLGTAVNTAVKLGATAISNSYGGSDSTALSAYNHPGIAITASTGDSGYGVQSPASFGTVVAVGGTSLKRDTSTRGWTESAWSGAGSGCSSINANPGWQTGTSCPNGKANADVSAVADPNTGVAVYDSYSYQGASGWMVFGGTSASSPIVASVYAMGGKSVNGSFAAYTWANPSGLNDVTSGTNGTCATPVWCTAGSGWDGPTGLGTPNGVASF